jgi:DNA repair exonuclease SbcCD ATPase subunit
MFTSQHDPIDYVAQNSELQRSLQNLKLTLVEREQEFSQVLANGHVNEKVISDFITSAHRVGEFNAEIRSVKSELDIARQKVSDLQEEREQQSRTEQNLRQQVTSLTRRLSENREPHSPTSVHQLASLRFENSQLKQECGAQEAKNAQLTVELLRLQSRLDDYTNDDIRADSSTTRLRAQVQALQAKLAQSELEKEKLMHEIESLKDDLSRKQTAITRTTRQIQASEQSVVSFARTILERAELFKASIDRANSEITGSLKTLSRSVQGFRRVAENDISRVITQSEVVQRTVVIQSQTTVQKLSLLCARLSGVKLDTVPGPEQLAGDDQTLAFFIGKVETAADVREAAQKSGVRKLEQLAQSTQRQSLSSAVANAVRTVQGAVKEMTKVLHEDHQTLIETLSVDGTN